MSKRLQWEMTILAGLLGVVAATLGAAVVKADAERAGVRKQGNKMLEKATFAAGCFWGTEALFRELKGVVNTTVGYTGGTTTNPTYEDVCSHTTGHAEAVLIEYDPYKVSYEELLEIFWSSHDPTAKNRQGPDIGSQYRSAIFYHTPSQREASRSMKERLERSGRYDAPIVTEIVPAAAFYKAEEYHQRYFEKHAGVPCHLNLKPKKEGAGL